MKMKQKVTTNHEKLNNEGLISKAYLVGKDNSGVAMIVALVVGVVAMVFCLSLLLVAYTLYAQTNRKNLQTKCKLLAQSSLKAVELELMDNTSNLDEYLYNQIKNGLWVSIEEDEANGEGGALAYGSVAYLTLNLNHGDSAAGYNIIATFSYSMSDDSEDEVLPDGPDDQEGNESGNAGGGEAPEDNTVGAYTIFVDVTCVRGSLEDRDSQSYTISAEYTSVTLGR